MALRGSLEHAGEMRRAQSRRNEPLYTLLFPILAVLAIAASHLKLQCLISIQRQRWNALGGWRYKPVPTPRAVPYTPKLSEPLDENALGSSRVLPHQAIFSKLNRLGGIPIWGCDAKADKPSIPTGGDLERVGLGPTLGGSAVSLREVVLVVAVAVGSPKAPL